MAAMNMVSAGGFSGVSFHLRRCPQGVTSVLCKKTPIFGSRRSKLDHLTVLHMVGVRPLCPYVARSHDESGYQLGTQMLRDWRRELLLRAKLPSINLVNLVL
jgi:hypothetical protein